MPVQQDVAWRHYLDVLIRRRRVIVSTTLLVTLLAGLYTIVSPPPYAAAAVMAVIKTKTNVALENRVQTLSDEDLAAAGVAEVLNAETRRAALAGLVENSTIADAVIKQLGDQLSPELQNPAKLVAKVEPVIQRETDLVGIEVSDDDPVMAATIANTWARQYEIHINRLYSGAPTDLSDEVSAELQRAQQQRDDTQKALEAFILNNRITDLRTRIGEKQVIIDELQKGRSTAVATLIDEEIKAQQHIINAYYSAQAENRLLAFNAQQNAKRQVLAAYIDAELDNRLKLFHHERNLRELAFDAAVRADFQGKEKVLNEEISQKTDQLSTYYSQVTTVKRLLENARLMRRQVNTGGEAAAASNSVALLLLKAQALTPSEGIPANLQLQLAGGSAPSAVQQIADLDALIETLEGRLGELDEAIKRLSQELLDGTGYNFLDDAQFTTVLSMTTPLSGTQNANTLANAISQRYRELYEVGTSSADLSSFDDSELFAEIKKLYPDLFTVDQVMLLAESIPADNPLAQAAADRAEDLLQLKNLEELPNFSVQSKPMTQLIRRLSNDIRELSVQLEREESQRGGLEQARDLAREVYNTLYRKQAELNVSSAITGSQVRLASPAVTPLNRSISPLIIVIVGALLGLLLGLVVATLLQLLAPSFVPRTIIGDPNLPWNQAVRWVLTPANGLPSPTSDGRVRVYPDTPVATS